jgi:hypothetical protein
MKKTPHNSMKKEKATKKLIYDGDYLCMFSLREKPVDIGFIDRLAEQLVEWVRTTPKAFKISEFRLDRGINHQTWDNWIKKYPLLKAAHEYAKEKIGNHRELQASLKDGMYDSAMIKPTMGHYCPVWRAEQVYLAELNKKLDPQNGPVTVIMNSMPSSDEVPPKGSK